MAGFEGFGLFDPEQQDERLEEEEEEDVFLSAAEILEKRKKKPSPGGAAGAVMLMSRSKSGLSLKKASGGGGGGVQQRAAVPRSTTCIDLKSAVRAGRGIRTRTLSVPVEDDYLSLPPEPQMGNIEYKLKLVNPSATRLQHLVTQMKWRLREGNGEALYNIGVEDNGVMTGLSDEEMASSLDTLQDMARRLGATVQVLRQRRIVAADGLPERIVAEILVRKIPEDQQAIELRVCVLGSADVGKSTLLGVLTQGELDNGRGRARLNMFRHLHEIQSGRTSSISHEILGFDADGNPIDYSSCATADEIGETSTKLITFIDLAGHHKYLKTTISALTGYCPHYVMLLVSATAGVVGMTQEHLGIAVALEVPFFIVVTKTDATSAERVERTLESVAKILKSAGSNKVPLVVKSFDDCITAASNSLKQNTVPIFCISSVLGTGLDFIKRFLYLLPPGVGEREAEKLEQEGPEFQIDELFEVPGVGTVCGGLVTQGFIVENMPLAVGPFEDGKFKVVQVSSIRRNKAACRLVRAQQSAALAVDIPISQLRRGMVMTSPKGDVPTPCLYFQANVCLLFHPTEIMRGFRTTVHIGNIRQTAVIEGIRPLESMKSSDQASVVFRFIKNPEFVKLGARILFREGRTKGIGRVSQVFPFKYKEQDKMLDR